MNYPFARYHLILSALACVLLSVNHSAGTLSMSATIIDHREIDRALLAEAARRRGAKFDVLVNSV